LVEFRDPTFAGRCQRRWHHRQPNAHGGATQTPNSDTPPHHEPELSETRVLNTVRISPVRMCSRQEKPVFAVLPVEVYIS
jgi:hypothetical protein